MSDISDIIKYEVKQWTESEYFNINKASDINNGKCSQFAKSVKDTMGNPKNLEILSYGYNGKYSSNAHKWIYYEGKHYDAECPEGVNKPQNLPIFQRNNIQSENIEIDSDKLN